MKAYTKKYRIIIILIIMTFIIFSSGIAYSFFHTRATFLGEANIAKFIFNAEQLEELDFPLSDLNPGDKLTFPFAISNSQDEDISNVTVDYQIVVKTFHLAPILIKLYKIENNSKTLVLNCNESYSRNSQNEIVCNTEKFEMSHLESVFDQYELEVFFPTEYNSISYSNLLDYINLEVKSWQRIE